MKGVGLLSKALNKEGVQPDLESLDGNMEVDEEGEGEGEEEKENLGRLHFKLDYDFNKSEVCMHACPSCIYSVCICLYNIVLQNSLLFMHAMQDKADDCIIYAVSMF